MNPLRQATLGVLTALFSALIIFGSMLLALTEGGHLLAMAITPTHTFTPPPPVATPKPGEPTFTPTLTPLPSATPTLPVSDLCPMPVGWQTINILPGDTLSAIAEAAGIAIEDLRQANCLTSDTLLGGNFLFIPIPTATPTPTVPPPTATPAPIRPTNTRRPAATCSGPPPGWVIYIVRRGDTLYAIGQLFGVNVQQLQSANCLTSAFIFTGQRLHVPNIATRTLRPTATPRPTNTSAPLPTTAVPATPLPPTPETPAATTPPPTISPSDTPMPSPTPVTPTVAPTDPPTDVPSPSPTPVTSTPLVEP